MSFVQPTKAREFAVRVVSALRKAGFEALWAGGCVRDELMDRLPKDYDVATSATPPQIRGVLGKKRTRAIGAAFGVITVIGPRGSGQIDVATFRCDATYSDGRHPDSVTFSTAEEDARRRDFTVNGLFYDPVSQQVIDYVGGCEDLRQRKIRAIGDPHERIREDKLRMLRAVRFATTLDFEIDRETQAATQQHAAEITVVSGERIAEELRRFLVHPQRRRGTELLRELRLLPVIFPELALALERESVERQATQHPWLRTLSVLASLEEPTFPVALAALLRETCVGRADERQSIADTCRRLRLANEERDSVLACLEREETLRTARRIPWPTLQRLLVAPRIEESLVFAAAVARTLDGRLDDIDHCRRKLALPPEVLNPTPLITGSDLIDLGIPPGSVYKHVLEEVRDAQLLGTVKTRDAAIDLAKAIWNRRTSGLGP